MASFLDRVKGYISQPVGRASQAVGRTYDYLTPGGGSSTLTNAGRAIVDPNQVYTGSLNPYTALVSQAGYTNFQPVTNQNPSQPSQSGDSYPQQVLGSDTTATSGTGTDLSQYRNNVLGRIQAIQQAYD